MEGEIMAPTLSEVLARAIEKEIGSQMLYQSLSQRVSQQATRDVFLELVQQERGHQHLLEQYQRGELKRGALSPDHVVDYGITEKLDSSMISADMGLKDAFLVAANREKISHELYLSLAQIHPGGEVKKLFKQLAAQELEHKHRVELLYTEVAFPQTDGG
jgi:rubrerythrin